MQFSRAFFLSSACTTHQGASWVWYDNSSADSKSAPGKPIAVRTPREAIDAGIAYMTEDRKGKGLLLQEQLGPNLTLSSLKRFHPALLLNTSREAEALSQTIERYDIRLGSLDVRAGQLSGGLIFL